ncbi:DUF4870 domain-containing protein [Actinopolymorpha pittospori]|uniref:Tic20 family protein n=1 Tax=Actinopolymorpha pittospori TaxID=648752 RepID=A0A927N0Q0_9ACTN|nr:DUF4870 domain-containing protein [Actinopolymorpha pittospori]MBE1608783.1 putative Tic20 family protein [Actinopolymorpha pittospori]
MTGSSEEDRPENGSPPSPSTPSGSDQPTPATPYEPDQPPDGRPDPPEAAEPPGADDLDRTIPIPESPGPMPSTGPLPPNGPGTLPPNGPPDPGFASGSPWPRDEQPGVPPSRMGVEEERNWALAAHLGSFIAAYVALGFLCPLIVLLSKGKLSPFVRHHAIESLNFQLTALLAAIIAGLLVFVIIGLVLLPFLGIAYLVLVILASIAARRGEWYRYPVTIRFLR